MISVDSDWKRVQDDLEKLNKRGFPFAMRNALNDGAFQARREWGHEITETFQTRNKWTAGRALVVEKATGARVSNMEAIVGSTARFMGDQEKGFTHKGRSKHLPIPGPAAAGQSPGQKRTGLIRKTNRLRAIAATQAPKTGKTRKQRNAVAISMAKKKGQKYAVLERPKGGRAIFRLQGSKKKPTTRLVWDLSRSSAVVRPHPTLKPVVHRINVAFPGMMKRSLMEQVRRAKAFGN